MKAKVLVRYGEIALKGKNRGEFEQQLQSNLKNAVSDLGGRVARLHGRLLVTGPEQNFDKIIDRTSKTFGVVSVSKVRETELDLEKIKVLAAEIASEIPPDKLAFRVDTRRSNKDFPYDSQEINHSLGAYLQSIRPELVVNLKNPDFTIYIEVGFDKAYIYQDRVAGPGGLPLGVTGRCLLLLSGGIDSPVAGWLAMKRGMALEALHFHSFPFTSRRAQEKAVDLCRKLAVYGNVIRLHMISVTSIQKEINENCPKDYSIILLRRMMYRLAEKLSLQHNLQALVTGESLGQVASQTLESIEVVSKATSMMVLRPLVGMDKTEIINKGIEIDTYETSILPYEDCCTVFLPKNPVTRPRLENVLQHEANLDIDALVDEALATLETKTVAAR